MTMSSRSAPSLEEFAALARASFDTLPEEFKQLCGNVVIHVAETAEPQLLAELGIGHPLELTGLYEGVDVTRQSVSDPAAEPAHVHLYRAPILAELQERGNISLNELVTHVLVHEIGHHFGLSDEQMHEIEERAD